MKDLVQTSRNLLVGSKVADYRDERERVRTYEAYVMVGNLQLFFTPILTSIVILTCGKEAMTPAFSFLFLLVFCRAAGIIYMLTERVSFTSSFKRRPLRGLLQLASFISVPISIYIKYPHTLPTANHLSLVVHSMEIFILAEALLLGVISWRNSKK